MAKLAALGYYGGKSATANQGTGPWIASLLPHRTDVLYLEPFAGMLGVLLIRPKSKMEIVNDLDDSVINWWRQLRDYPEEFARRVELTPHSRREYEWSKRNMRNATLSPMQRAVAFHVAVSMGMAQGPAADTGSWKVTYSAETGSIGLWKRSRIYALAERMRHVQLECRDANVILERASVVERSVIYCDPPYRDADTSSYDEDVDRGRLGELLNAQRGYVAISGFNDEWDHLGWQRHSRTVQRHTLIKNQSLTSDRTEVLWTNYEPESEMELGLFD